MNERAVSTRWPSPPPGRAPRRPGQPSAFDSVTVATTSSAPGQPDLGQQPAPARAAHPEPVRLVDHEQRAAGPADGVQRRAAAPCRRRRCHALGDDQRPLLASGRRARRRRPRRRRAAPPRPAPGTAGRRRRATRGSPRRTRQGARARQRGQHAEVRGVAGGEHQRRRRTRRTRRARAPAPTCSAVVPVTSREPVEPAPQVTRRGDRAADHPRIPGEAEVVVAGQVEHAVGGRPRIQLAAQARLRVGGRRAARARRGGAAVTHGAR